MVAICSNICTVLVLLSRTSGSWKGFADHRHIGFAQLVVSPAQFAVFFPSHLENGDEAAQLKHFEPVRRASENRDDSAALLAGACPHQIPDPARHRL